jgi:hypothetical protein
MDPIDRGSFEDEFFGTRTRSERSQGFPGEQIPAKRCRKVLRNLEAEWMRVDVLPGEFGRRDEAKAKSK